MSLGEWIRRVVRAAGAPPPRVGERTGQYLRTAHGIFLLDAGGRIPEDCAEMTAMIRRSGARIEGRGDVPRGLCGAMLADRLYVDTGLPLAARRRVILHLWARFLCWRDRGGPACAVYAEGCDAPGRDGYSRVAGLFERIAQEADPAQPKREPTLY